MPAKTNKALFPAAAIVSIGLLLQGCFAAVAAGGAAAGTAVNSQQSSLSLGTQTEDMVIKSKAMGVLNNMKGLRYRSNVEVVVFDRQVLLLGQVPSQTYVKEVAEKIARIPKVSVVYNHLNVARSIAFSTYAHDAWITTKVKANMVNKVNPFHFKVVTEKGVVYLLARTTPKEGKLAAEIASRTSGVKKVVQAYTYIKPTPAAKVKNVKLNKQTDTKTASPQKSQ